MVVVVVGWWPFAGRCWWLVLGSSVAFDYALCSIDRKHCRWFLLLENVAKEESGLCRNSYYIVSDHINHNGDTVTVLLEDGWGEHEDK